MSRNTPLRQLMALLYIFLLITSPFAVGQEIPEVDGQSSYVQFSSDPNLWTADNFNQLSPADQLQFLKNNYRADLAAEFYKNQNNVGLDNGIDFNYFGDKNNAGKNPAADDVFFSSDYSGTTETTLRDFLQQGISQKEAAAEYFTQKFNAFYTFEEVGNDFLYNVQEGTLTNGKKTIKLNQFKDDTSIQGIVSIADGFKIIKKLEQGSQEISVQGDGERILQYDAKDGNLIFKDRQGKEQSFEITAAEPVNFAFSEDGTLEVEGPVSGMVNLDHEHQFAEFRNREGKLIIHSNGDLEARDALVETAKLYLDGRFEYHQEENKVDAYDIMSGDRKTIIVDKDSRVGAKTQGQIKGESTLEVHLSKVSEQSEYFVKPDFEVQPTVQEVLDNLQKVRPPQGDAGENAEVYIKTNKENGKTIVTAKGKVEVGFYDFITGSVSLSEKEPHFIGVNGISEFDLLAAAQSQVNIRGQAAYSDDQYSRIDAQQDGASLKIIKNDFDEIIHSGCFSCPEGSTALSIGKQVATAVQTGDVFSEPEFRTISISATVTEEGLEYDWDNFLSDIGSLADSKTEGREIILGKNMLMKNVLCEGTQQCNLMLARDQQSGTTSAFYEVYDPETNQVSKRVTIPTNIGETVGSVTILTSAGNVQKLQQIQTLLEQRRFGEVSTLLKGKPFDDDPALRQHLLKTTGVDIQQLDNLEYTQKLNGIVRYYAEAQEKIKALKEDYGINLDQSGVPVTEQDQQKLNEILNKRRVGSEIAVFDLYSGARVDLARGEKEQVEAVHQSCAGSAYCPVGDEEVKAAQQKVVVEVSRREKSPEGIEWKQNFELQKEKQKEAEQLKDKLADAQKLGQKRDSTERELTRDKAVLEQTLQDLQNQEEKIRQLQEEKKKAEGEVHYGDFVRIVTGNEDQTTLQRLQGSLETAEQEKSFLEEQKFSLEKRIDNGKAALQNNNQEITSLTLDFKEPTSKLALLSAYGDDETVAAMIEDADIPQEKKNELLYLYVSPEVSFKVLDINADPSLSYDQKQERINEIIGTGKVSLKQAQNIADMYGDVAAASVILDQVAATRPDLVDSPEWRAAKNSHDQAVDNQVAELKKIAEQNLQEKIKMRDGKEASIFGQKNSIADQAISALGTAAEGIGTGIRWVSFKTVAGTLAVAGGTSYLLGAEETGADLIEAAVGLHTYDDVKHQKEDAEISLLHQQIKSYDQVQQLLAEARQRGEKPDTALMQNAFSTQAPIVNLAKQMEGKKLTIDDQAQVALYNVEQSSLVAGGDALVKGQYAALNAEYAGKSDVANIAHERVSEAEQTAEGSFLTNEDLALYGDPIIDTLVDVSNLIPGAVFVKAGKAAAKVAEVTKITEAAAKIGKAIEIAKDGGKLLTVSAEARLALKTAKAELKAAQITKGLTVAERTAEIVRAEKKVNLARQSVEAEYRATKIGKTAQFLSTPVSSDLRALEKLRLAAEDEQFKAAARLQELSAKEELGAAGAGYRASVAEELRVAQEAYQKAAQKITDIEKAKEAYSLAGSDLGTVFEETALGKQRAIGPGAEKAQQALDEFQQARKAYHDERIAFGADKVSTETVENLVRTAKAAEQTSFENRLSDAIRGALGAQRVERNVEKLKAANIALSFTEDGRLVGEGLEAGSAESILVENSNDLLADDAVVRNLVGEDLQPLTEPKDIPPPPRKLSEPEFEELEALDKELESRGAAYKLTEEGNLEINIDEIVTADAQDLEQLRQKAQRAEQLLDEADKEELVKQVQARRSAEAVLADNDLQQVAEEVKNDLTTQAKGGVDTGIVSKVAGEKADELPKPAAKTEVRVAAGDDLPRPEAVEEAINSRSAGTYSILETVQQEGKPVEARGLDLLPGDANAAEQTQKTLSELPETGTEVKIKTLNGNRYEGRALLTDDNVIIVEHDGRRERVLPEDVISIEVESPRQRGVSEAVEPCAVAGGAVHGLAGCGSRTAAQTPLSKFIPEARPQITKAPPPVSGEEDWNNIVKVIERHPGVRLTESDLKILQSKKDLFIGEGGEGIVLDIPPSVEAAYNLPGDSVIKIQNIEEESGLEGIVNGFPEQAEILNRLADKGAAPHIYRAEETYYIAEKINGKTLQEAMLERLTPTQKQAYDLAFADQKIEVIKEAVRNGQFDDLFAPVDELTDVLVTENLEVVDFHWKNILIDEENGKLKAKIPDAGLALPGDPATIRETYDQKIIDAFTGKGFVVSGEEIQKTRLERGQTVISSDLIDKCAVAGGAIYGLGACPVSAPIPLEKRVESSSAPEISGVRLKAPTGQADPATLVVTGEEQWNDLVAIIEKHEHERSLGPSDLERLVNDPEYIGRGAEGVVLKVPEEVRVALGIDKPAVVKIRNYRETPPRFLPTEETALTFPESAELLNSVKNKDVTPEVYKWGENYYIVEELEGATVDNLVLSYLSPEELSLYKQAKTGAEKRLILEKAFPRAREDLEPVLDTLTDTLAEAGLVVDDFHPGNVLLVQTDEGVKAKVVDVGYAYTIDPESAKEIYVIKKEELLRGGGQEVSPILLAARQSQREAAGQALEFFNNFPPAAEAIEAATPQQLEKALRATGVEDEKVISYVLVPEGKRIDRIYEGKVDPLDVALKLDEGIPKQIEENLFELGGKRYAYDPEKGWVEQRKFWFDKKVDDAEIVKELETARAPEVSEAEIVEAVSLPPCQAGIVGQAIGCVVAPGKGTFKLNDKQYVYDADQGWIQQQKYWFNKKVTDTEELSQLETLRLKEINIETPAEWKETLTNSEEFSKVSQEASEKGAPVSIGETDFYFRDANGELVEGVETLVFIGNIGESKVFEMSLYDLNKKTIIAGQTYHVTKDVGLGEIIKVKKVTVQGPYRQVGVNQRLFKQISDLHPEAKYAEGTIDGTNYEIYKNYLNNNPDATTLDAIKQIPAYKIRKSAGWEIDVERSNLPALNELELVEKGQWKPFVLTVQRESNEPINLLPCSVGGAVVGRAAAGPCIRGSKSIDDLEEGKHFMVRSKSGNLYNGKFVGQEGEFLIIQTGEKKRFFGLFGTKKETNTLRIENLDQSSIILEGEQIRITAKDGISYNGIYAGEDAEFLRITYPNGDTLRFRKSDLDFNTIIGEEEQLSKSAVSTTEDIFRNQNLDQLAGKKEEEIINYFYKNYNRKTAPSIIEEGKVSHGQTSIELYNKIGPEKKIDVDALFVQEGWIGLKSIDELPRGSQVRYYFNSKNFDSSQVVLEKVARELSDQQIPFRIKAHPDKAAFARRTDNTVLYIDAVHRDKVERVIAGLDPRLLDKEVPLFTRPVSRGVSWAEEPGNVFYKGLTTAYIDHLNKYGIKAPSFGQARSEALAEIYAVTKGRTGPEFDEITRDIFQKHGIDPDEPWLNFDSQLKDFPSPQNVKLQPCPLIGSAIARPLFGGAAAGPCMPPRLPSEGAPLETIVAEHQAPKVVSTVQGYEGTVSNLYDRVTPENIDEVFQHKLEQLGPEIYGGKAVAYIHDDGTVQVVFLTESDKTHHRQALGTIIGGEKGDLVYNGQYQDYRIADLTDRAFGFEFQYDKAKGKIVGIQASSQISNLQKSKGIGGWKLPDAVVDRIEEEMLEKIDLDLVDESIVDKPIDQWVDRSRIPVSSSS